jgi:CheY-like chemotaxis protein
VAPQRKNFLAFVRAFVSIDPRPQSLMLTEAFSGCFRLCSHKSSTLFEKIAMLAKRFDVRVLLIEDDSGTAQSIEIMLKTENFTVHITDLGEEGVDLGKVYDYDIILLDLNLPDVSGYEVLRSLRAAKVATPILILSGFASIEDKIRGLGLGADDYLQKPFHRGELVARIQAIVRRSKGYTQARRPASKLLATFTMAAL